jgi:hypothetical protein
MRHAQEIRRNAVQPVLLSGDESAFENDKYQLVIEATSSPTDTALQRCVEAGTPLSSVGGLYPNPSVLGAAPGYGHGADSHPSRQRRGTFAPSVRIAENGLSLTIYQAGVVGLGSRLASIPMTSSLRRIALPTARSDVARHTDDTEALRLDSGTRWSGDTIEVEIFPKPVQSTLPIGCDPAAIPIRLSRRLPSGANVVTALLFLSVEDLAERLPFTAILWRSTAMILKKASHGDAATHFLVITLMPSGRR